MKDQWTPEKAKRRLLGITIPRDELAFRIAQPCLGIRAPEDTDATAALDKMDTMGGPVRLGASFRQAADAAVAYFHQCIQAGTQPQ